MTQFLMVNSEIVYEKRGLGQEEYRHTRYPASDSGGLDRYANDSKFATQVNL